MTSQSINPTTPPRNHRRVTSKAVIAEHARHAVETIMADGRVRTTNDVAQAVAERFHPVELRVIKTALRRMVDANQLWSHVLGPKAINAFQSTTAAPADRRTLSRLQIAIVELMADNRWRTTNDMAGSISWANEDQVKKSVGGLLGQGGTTSDGVNRAKFLRSDKIGPDMIYKGMGRVINGAKAQ